MPAKLAKSNTQSRQSAKSTGKGGAKKIKKKIKNLTTDGRAYVLAKFNNTLITITDKKGNKIAQESAGSCGYRGSRKSTPYAAQKAAEAVGELAKEHGLIYLSVYVKGPGPGRESAIRGLMGVGFKVTHIIDATPIPHNGVKPKKRRRI